MTHTAAAAATTTTTIIIIIIIIIPNKLAHEVAFIICVREVPGSNLGRDPDYPDWVFRGSLQSLQTNTGGVLYVGPRPFPSTTFAVQFSLHPNIRRDTV
jgi:hypothetical protein